MCEGTPLRVTEPGEDISPMKTNLVLACVFLVGEYSSTTVTEAQSSTQLASRPGRGWLLGLSGETDLGTGGRVSTKRLIPHVRPPS